MSRRHRSAHPCPTPSKQRFVSIEEAAAAYRRNQVNPVMRGMSLADWAYRCMCGSWHRTRRHERGIGGVPLDEVDDHDRA